MLAGPLALAVFLGPPDRSRENTAPSAAPFRESAVVNATAAAPSDGSGRNTSQPALTIPLGTILPVRLGTLLSPGHSKPGELITAKLMQEVPLPMEQRIPRGSTLYGKVVAIAPSAANGGAEISLRFDSLQIHKEPIPLTANLRAIAGYVDVDQAQIPVLSSGEGEVYAWLPTVQIGGDDVFGRDGVVTRWNDSSQVVGRSTPDGVLGHIVASQKGGCRGPVDGNDHLQALWVFSADACGVYGLPGVTIADGGRSNPAGLIVLRFAGKKVRVASGAGMLLRVDEAGR